MPQPEGSSPQFEDYRTGEITVTRATLMWILFVQISTVRLLPAEDKPSTAHGDALVAEYFRLETARLAKRTDDFLAGIKTVDQWEAEKPKLRKQLFEMLGLDPLPAKGDLKPVITGQVEHEEFIVEKLHFQSSPGLYVTGNFYRPKNVAGPLPTVLYVCGHSVNKKDGISYGNKVGYQHHGAWYARNGYACLTIDTLQLGEIEGLHHGTYKEGMWWWLSRGYTPAGVEAWNCIRALDYLETRPEVDKERIGVTGRSGGGAYSWYIAAIDERIQVAVPVAGITTLKNHIVDGCIEGHCDCMFQVNTYGWDYAMVAALVAPRPLLIANTDKDTIFPLDGVVEVHRQVRHIYDLYGKPEQLGLNITEGPHKDTQELQVHEFVWFNRFLKKAESPIDKVAVKFFEPEQLRVFEKLPEDQRNTRIQEEFVPVAINDIPQNEEEWLVQCNSILETLLTKHFVHHSTIDVPLETRKISQQSKYQLDWSEYEFMSEPPFRLTIHMVQPQGKKRVSTVKLHVLSQSEWDRVSPMLKRLKHEPEMPLVDVVDDDLIAFLKPLQEPDQAHVFFAPRGIGPTEWTREEKKRNHIRRRFALLGQTDDSGRVLDVSRATLVVRELSHTDPEKRPPLMVLYGEGDAAVWCLMSFDDLADGKELVDVPTHFGEGQDFLGIQRLADVPVFVAAAPECSSHGIQLRYSKAEMKPDCEFVREVRNLKRQQAPTLQIEP